MMHLAHAGGPDVRAGEYAPHLQPAVEPMRTAMLRGLLLGTSLLLAGVAGAADGGANSGGGGGEHAKPWRDTFTTRLEALALLQSLNADLLSHDSATLTLDRWCGTHHLAEPAKIVAERVRDVEKAATDEQRQLLGVSASEPLRYRRVRLKCGARVLSEADNWYVPARLTPEMNQALETSDIAFGRAVQALQFRRRTLSAELLWSPLPAGWEMTPPTGMKTGRELEVPPHVIQHKAVLTLPDGTPFSEVVETYTSDVLGFPEPAAPRR
jgi:chorismate-pyruvate lyase